MRWYGERSGETFAKEFHLAEGALHAVAGALEATESRGQGRSQTESGNEGRHVGDHADIIAHFRQGS